MKKTIFLKLENLYFRFQELEKILSAKNVIFNKKKYRECSKEYDNLSDLIACFKKWKKNKKEIKEVKLLMQDIEMCKEAEKEYKILNLENKKLEKKIEYLMVPTDPDDKYNCYLEIRAGTGGDESAIFAGDLFKMYMKYSETKLWNVDIINIHKGDKGGFKEIIIKISGKKVMRKLKFESGGHRVQRIPKTETQGRIHTSTCTVAVMPVKDDCEKNIDINLNDLKIDTFRSSGAGGQHVNTTDSAIRITHIPTGQVVECQDERSQHKNKSKALSVLLARIQAFEKSKMHEENAEIRRNLLGTGSRSDRNRTYNYPNNRITDHRINLTVHCLNEVLNGKLDILINPIIQEYQADKLYELSKKNK
ncbi:peptide chain release factor 1 [Buchnera aphidicola (Kurisakia onigurumii)]|uniref:peptide chain release factor 1 n=1 Tax=Buchnera aphidicola TaxID=9 RepID=UPI0031B69EE5